MNKTASDAHQQRPSGGQNTWKFKIEQNNQH